MKHPSQIPSFFLFGETGDFPDIIHCERIRDRALRHDWHIGPHRHGALVQMLYMEKGHADVRIDGREFSLNDQEILYIPAMAVHGFAFRQGAEGGVFSFPLTLISALPSASGEPGSILQHPGLTRVDTPLRLLLDALVSAFEGSGTFRAPLLAGIGKAILIAMAEAAARDSRLEAPLSQRRMAEFDELLRASPNAAHSAADYAQKLGITLGHLNRICRAATGSSAGSYIEAARMVEASRLLAFTRLSIAEVGYRLGYDDPPYFTRRFRHVTGETPSAYRARFLE